MADSITCSYTFSPEEYRTTALLSRRLLPASKKIIYYGIALVCLVIIGIGVPFLFLSSVALDYGGMVPTAITLVCVLFLLKRIIPLRAFCSVRAFRKRQICNRLVQNTISGEGIGSQTEHSGATLLWTGIGKARESVDGFAIFLTESRGTFIWFPFHGYASGTDIERSREFIRQNVKDYRRV
jgi:hypothetical protein